MIKRFFFSLCIFSQSQFVISQVPGYLGKRLFVSANFSAVPAIMGPTASNKSIAYPSRLFGESKSSLDFSTRYGIEVGYVTSRYKALTLTLDYAKTGLVSNLSPIPSFNLKLFYTLNCYTIDLGFQRYYLDRAAIAPLNGYFAMHSYITYVSGTSNTLGQSLDQNFLTGGVALEYGKNSIIADKIIISPSVRWNLSSGLIQGLLLSDELENKFAIDGTNRLFFHSIVMFKVGIGFIN